MRNFRSFLVLSYLLQSFFPGTLLFANSETIAQSTPSQGALNAALFQCFEGFVETYAELSSYQGILQKKEWRTNGSLVHDEKLEISFQKPHHLKLKYLNEGSSGIRNNGMTVEYRGGKTVKINLGKPKFFGALSNGVASLVVGDELSLFDPKVLDDEIFTINHGGFGYLVGAIKKVGAELKSNPEFKVIGSVTPEHCTVEYPLQSKSNTFFDLKPEDSIFRIEEDHRILAYFLYDANRDQFSSFTDLFVRTKPMRIRFPDQKVDLTLVLNRKTQLPEKIALKQDQNLIAEYQYSDFTVQKN